MRCVGVISLVCLSVCNSAIAFDDDSRLKQRIVELEAENRALRKVIAGIQGALESVPKSTLPKGLEARTLRIVVMPGKWGASELEDIRKVCLSAAGTFLSQLPDDGFAPILVQRSTSGPISLFQRAKGGEYIVKLDTSDRAWAQCAYQFSHEFCHVVCNYRKVKNPQLWFEESLAECASLYALRRMAIEWKTNAPYSNWKSYASSLGSYASERIKKYDDRKDSVADFYQSHKDELEKHATNRDHNGYFAIKLLPILEETPAAWQSLRYINLGPGEENLTFKDYLSGWHKRVPEKHKPFVQRIATEFGIELEQ